MALDVGADKRPFDLQDALTLRTADREGGGIEITLIHRFQSFLLKVERCHHLAEHARSET